jgi:hypothetical protein
MATTTSTATHPAPASPDAGRPGPVPGWARWFVRAFLVAFVVCGLAGIEAWPLTGFRLFSHLRTEQVSWWQPVLIDRAGVASDVSFSRLPVKDRDFVLTMRSFPAFSSARQAEVCRTWLDALRTSGVDAAELRLYLVERHLVPRAGRHPSSPPTRTLRFTCSDRGVVEAQGLGSR